MRRFKMDCNDISVGDILSCRAHRTTDVSGLRSRHRKLLQYHDRPRLAQGFARHRGRTKQRSQNIGRVA